MDLLLPVTLFVVEDEMLSKKIQNKKWNFEERTNDRVLRVTWAVPGGSRVARQRQHHKHGALHRVVAGAFQGYLAG